MGNNVMNILQTRDDGGEKQLRAFRFHADGVKDDGSFKGYGSVFGGEPNAYNELVAPGAFAESLAAHKAAGTMPAMLWQHDSYKPVGVYTRVVEDEHGLKVEGDLALNTQIGREAHELLKMGALNGLSIGFNPKKHEVDADSGIVTLTEIDLWEISIVTFPANKTARITDVRCDDEIIDLKSAERLLREAGLSKRQATAIVAGVHRVSVRGERDRVAMVELRAALTDGLENV